MREKMKELESRHEEISKFMEENYLRYFYSIGVGENNSA